MGQDLQHNAANFLSYPFGPLRVPPFPKPPSLCSQQTSSKKAKPNQTKQMIGYSESTWLQAKFIRLMSV